ncbi:MAG: antibiotic biosynthesis monooxygenase [Methylococcales bacterium]
MMYAVIFTAELNKLDNNYYKTAKIMRDLAIQQYGCVKFTSVSEGNSEISISYWRSKAKIKEWKKNKEHLKAQKMGKEKWYKNYTVEIVEILHEYGCG